MVRAIRVLAMVVGAGLLARPLFAATLMVQDLSGPVEIQRGSDARWWSAKRGTFINESDKVRTGGTGRANLLTDKAHRLQVHPNSTVQPTSLKGGEVHLGVVAGRVRAWVRKLSAIEKFGIKTPTMVCAVRGTDFAVEVGEGSSRLEVYEGEVLAKELNTGAEVSVHPGQFTVVQPNAPPAPPAPLPAGPPKTEAPAEKAKDEVKTAAEREMFQEISRDSVMQRAGEEIRVAEYQNGKTLVDAFGQRIRLEEYVTRPQTNQMKYVVLNTRADRFDFGKILFTFNKDLPSKLSDATQTAFVKTGPTPPEWYPTDISSVLSNTQDQLNDELKGGHPIPNDPLAPTKWTTFFSVRSFYVNDPTKAKPRWTYTDNGDNIIQDGEFTYLGGSKPTEAVDYPSGSDRFHVRTTNTYGDGFTITQEQRMINDDGSVVSFKDLLGKPGTSSNATDLREGMLKLNLEQTYTSSAFAGRKIDLVQSVKLMSDVGLITIPQPPKAAPASLSGTPAVAGW